MEHLNHAICGIECRFLFMMSGISLLVSGVVIELLTR